MGYRGRASGERYVVPTGRVVVPTGRYVVPAGNVIIIVSPGRLSLVATGRVLSPGRVKQDTTMLQSNFLNDHVADSIIWIARDIRIADKARPSQRNAVYKSSSLQRALTSSWSQVQAILHLLVPPVLAKRCHIQIVQAILHLPTLLPQTLRAGVIQSEKLGTGGDVLEMAKWHASGSTKRRSDEISGERSGEEGPQSARESAVVVRREWVGRCRREDQCEGDMLFLEGCARGGTVRREGRGDGGGGRVRRGRAQGGRGLSDHGVEAEGRCVDRSGGCESGWGGTLEVGFERLYTMTVRRQVCSVLVTREEDGIRQSGIHNKELDSRGEGVKRLLDDLYRKVGGSMELSESTQGLSAPNRAGYS
ncbi:hypothetical protein Tco_1562473 [Tanacetum coccineum]